MDIVGFLVIQVLGIVALVDILDIVGLGIQDVQEFPVIVARGTLAIQVVGIQVIQVRVGIQVIVE